MKIGVLGIGAVGGYFGAKLAHAGQDVTFIGSHGSVEAIKEKGIKVFSHKGDFELKQPKVEHDFIHIQDADVILFCLKSYNTKEVAEALKKRISDKAVIISLQNGVENEDILADIFGANRVIGATVVVRSHTPERGVIKHTGYGKMTIGELSKEKTPRIEKITKTFIDAGIPTAISTDIKKDLWKKLIMNIAYNGFTSLVGDALTRYHDIPEAQESFLKVMKEAQQVAQAEGHNVTDEDMEDLIKATKTENFANYKTSTLRDIESGKQLEIESLQGIVIKAAKKHNIDIPANKLLYALLKLKF